MSKEHPISKADPYELSEAPECVGCGLEADVRGYWLDSQSKKRVGFTCTCGARIIRGIVVSMSDFGRN